MNCLKCDFCYKEITIPLATINVKLGNGDYSSWYRLANNEKYINLHQIEIKDGHLCEECLFKLIKLYPKNKYFSVGLRK